MNTTLGSQIVARSLLIQGLLSDAVLVGGIYSMGYDECMVLTNDLWKKQAGGVPQHCFLLATAMVPGRAPDPEDEEIILLRVVGPALLPAESELVQVRADAMREMVVTHGRDAAASTSAILDVLTRNEIQFSAVKAKVLGTFYEQDVDGKPLILFGNDVETFYSASHYKVYKPYAGSLERIVSYPELTEKEAREQGVSGANAERLRIGTVRYSSTNRRGRTPQSGPTVVDVPVRVNVEDFISLKTAVFGMTRLGKSNTMKTVATAIAQHAAETSQNVGQLLFDPAGEYANVNVQDRTALSQIGTEFVTIFRYGVSDDIPGVKPLSTNFYADATKHITWSIVGSFLQVRNQSNYVQSFLAADIVGPDTPSANDGQEVWSAYRRAQRRRAAFYAILMKAGFDVPQGFATSISINKDVLNTVNQRVSGRPVFRSDDKGRLRLSADDVTAFWDAFLAARVAGANIGDWTDAGIDAILDVYSGTVGSGYRLLEPLRKYHSPSRKTDYATDVLSELASGKIVIVDLSLGSESVLKFCSERIINHILEDATRRFTEGQEPYQIQIYLEEAHVLFNRDKANVPSERDPYVRLAKEAAKFKIGLIYATQEVSSVDPDILSNTSNWIVTHLNNHAEIRELSKYYDFADFGDLTLKSEDVGFARIKTRSGRYIVPVQIDLFDETRVVRARDACIIATGRKGSQ